MLVCINPDQIQDLMLPKINAFLQQRTSDIVSMDTTISTLVDMMKDVEI